MKKVLFVVDTYYPDSSATTNIFRRIAEALVNLGYNVDVFPSEISDIHYEYPQMYNGVNIIHSNKLIEVLDSTSYDYVFSGAVNFRVNFLIGKLLKNRKCLWFPMSYDPYAFDPHISQSEKEQRIKEEIDGLKDATKIFFLTEFKNDYIGSPFEDKITYFMLPCIRELQPDVTKRVINFDKSYINCVFLGDFYLGVENTDFIFRLFEKIIDQNKKVRLYTVGNLGDYQETVNSWEKKLGENYICHPRISQEESYNVMFDADVLVSMGHDSNNMCPSKIVDFITSGQPIVHIQKIKDCCGKKYLEKYPNKICIYQNEPLTDSRVQEIEKFIVNSVNKERIDYHIVNKLYSDFTMESLIDKIIEAFTLQ